MVQKQQPEVFFYIKGVLKNFAKFTRKYLCQSLLFNKVSDLRPTTLLKRNSEADVFLWILQILKNTFFTEFLWTTVESKYFWFFRAKFCEQVNSTIQGRKAKISNYWHKDSLKEPFSLVWFSLVHLTYFLLLI